MTAKPGGLRVIGAGFGRTGTSSLKRALEMLGFDPCYHMEEVIRNPAHIPVWEAASAGQPVDWKQFFEGWAAAVDFPAALYYRELTVTWPEAKVVLSTRDPESWFRHGVQVLIAAFNIRTGEVIAQVRAHRTGPDLVALMEEVAARVGGRVVIIWDNLNIHYDGKDLRWARFNERHGNRFEFVYTPKHASWVNQVELWFSIVERRVLRHGSFRSPSLQAERVMGFVEHWNTGEGHPFRWRFRGEPARTWKEAA